MPHKCCPAESLGFVVQARAEGVPAGFSPELLAKMEESSKRLSKGRKKRVTSPSLVTSEALAEFTLLASQPLHMTSKVRTMACLPTPKRQAI